MRSIRLSLVVYFLGLLGVALGVASLLVYRTVQRTLEDKEAATRKLIQARYEESCAKERQRLDETLRTRALTLAGRVQIQVHWGRLAEYRSLPVLGLAAARLGPNAHLLVPFWAVQIQGRGPQLPRRGPNPFSTQASLEQWRSTLGEIKLNEDVKLEPLEPQRGEYFQIDTNSWSPPLCSSSAVEKGLSFPDPKGFAEKELLTWELDDLDLAPGLHVRRVRLKAPGPNRRRPPPPPRPQAVAAVATTFGLGQPGGQPWNAVVTAADAALLTRPARPVEPPPVFLVIQFAIERGQLDAELERFRKERDKELDSLNEETVATLAQQRNQLFAISSVTFAATVLGAFGLVWLGLLPLGRLSEAVSRVSPRDFRLPLDPGRLPMELQPIAQRLTGTLDLLKRAFAREKQATADISHELRTPLAALLTTTELALRKPRSAEHYRELLQDCRLSAQQMNQIVERLLTLARLDAGVDVLRAQRVDVAAVAEQCAEVVRPLAEARGVRLAVHNRCGQADEAGPSQLATDPDKLREVLTNLLHNAIQYNRPDGAIDLTVARDNGHLQVEVRDTGVGIAREAMERVFERFYRADPSRNSDGLHAGLGLAIVKEYVDLMGGTIAVDSALGQGSTFRVRLPAC